MVAQVECTDIMGSMVSIHIDKDPFPVLVDHRQIQKVGTQVPDDERVPLKELRRKARSLKVPDWEELGREELEAAVAAKQEENDSAADTSDDATDEGVDEEVPTATAQKRTVKGATASRTTRTTKAARSATRSKGPANKKAASSPKATGNPFRKGSNLYLVTEALMKGGKRKDLVNKLRPHMEFNPRQKSAKEWDDDLEIDRRLKAIGYLLKSQYGWDYTLEGRGPEAFIQVAPPS
jgi:hypothetical protein